MGDGCDPRWSRRTCCASRPSWSCRSRRPCRSGCTGCSGQSLRSCSSSRTGGTSCSSRACGSSCTCQADRPCCTSWSCCSCESRFACWASWACRSSGTGVTRGSRRASQTDWACRSGWTRWTCGSCRSGRSSRTRSCATGAFAGWNIQQVAPIDLERRDRIGAVAEKQLACVGRIKRLGFSCCGRERGFITVVEEDLDRH